MKRIIIGGSGSTGSSLLNNILGRNPFISSTIETSLFCKRELFENFDQNKWRIPYRFPFGLKNIGHHIYRKTDLIRLRGMDAHKLKFLLRSSNTLQGFADKIFATSGSDTWVEKTPANACNFDLFLKTFDNSYVIHTIRNPYDTLTSLLDRGYSGAYAAGIYMVNTLCGLKSSSHKDYIEVKYESLTSDPDATIHKVLNRIGIEYQRTELIPGESKSEFANIDTWKKDELGPVEPNENRFLNTSEEKKETVLTIIDCIGFSQRGSKYYDLPVINFKELIQELNYPVHESDSSQKLKKLHRSLLKDKVNRLSKMYCSHFFNYPLQIIQ